jgi:hypothetical protein
MPKPLRFNANVVSDLQKGIDWYDRISFPLGNRFRAAVRAQFREIAAEPQRFGFAFDDVRFARLARFPYVVLFREVNQVVMVLGVLHASSDPRKWRQRLSET